MIVALLALTAALAGDSLPTARTLTELQQQLDSIRIKHKVPGVGIALVTRDSILWAGGLGLRDLAAKTPMTAETHFRIGSITKSFVSLGILRLVEQGKLRLETPIRELIPEIAIDNPWEATRPVTVANLLEHTAGFDDMHFNEMYVPRGEADRPIGEVLAINPNSRRVRWEPGTRFSYSNPGYAVAGYLLEKTAGMPYDRYIRDSILVPLGMNSASFALGAADTAAISQGYNGASSTPVGYPRIYLRPAGTIHTSPLELARLVRMFLNHGTLDSARIIAAETQARMERTETTTLAAAGVPAGYGLGNYATLSFPVLVHGHSGGIDGFSSELMYSAEAGVGWVVLVNGGEGGLREMIQAVGRFMLRDVIGSPAPAIQLSSAELEKYRGYYRLLSPRAQLFAIAFDLIGGVRIETRGDSLYEKPLFGEPRLLVATGPNTFRAVDAPVTERAFVEGADGRMIYATGGDYRERVSIWPVWLGLAGLVVAGVLLAVTLLYALIWLPRRLFGRTGATSAAPAQGWALAAIALLVAFVLVAFKYGLSDGSTLNVASATTFGLSVLFPLVAIVALWKALRSDPVAVGRWSRMLGIAASVACIGVAAWLWSYGFVGLRTWVY